ncbi:MAG: tRNA 2-thiouridine(34) synthase MnmA [Planctomycetaceae bacterium]|nr:tRNA 2-thiouridine(34) synthase MnmA [Planctomycetaceae bacterium]
MKRVVLAMSGGVDSSVAAHLLLQQGHEVIGVFMRHGEEPVACSTEKSPSNLLPVVNQRMDHKQGCCTAEDAMDARRIADRLGIAFYALNLQNDFDKIMDYFVDEYVSGRTPNPCVMCNNWLKFGKLFDYADSVGADFVATGHYARLEQRDGAELPHLLRGLDDSKDQSYVLFGVRPDRLKRMLLPIGSYQKAEIRELAGQVGMRVADKRDSQEICFVTSGHHADFVRERDPTAAQAGEIVTTDGKTVGEHDGIERFTIGQRRGLGVAMGEPYFVVSIEPESRRVIIGRHEELARQSLEARQANWLCQPIPLQRQRCEAQIRYNSRAQAAEIIPIDERHFRVEFDAPCFGVAPGQAVVCYDGNRVLGGGWIV